MSTRPICKITSPSASSLCILSFIAVAIGRAVQIVPTLMVARAQNAAGTLAGHISPLLEISYEHLRGYFHFP